MRSTSHVAASAVPASVSVDYLELMNKNKMNIPQGKQAAGTPSKKRVPLTPLGPSVVRIAGIPSLCTDAVCQKSVPERREIFSAVVSFLSTSSTSKSFAIVEPLRGCFSGKEADGAMLSVRQVFLVFRKTWNVRVVRSGLGTECECQKRAYMSSPGGVRRRHGRARGLIGKIHIAADMLLNIGNGPEGIAGGSGPVPHGMIVVEARGHIKSVGKCRLAGCDRCGGSSSQALPHKCSRSRADLRQCGFVRGKHEVGYKARPSQANPGVWDVESWRPGSY
jgi:hypothetical protein